MKLLLALPLTCFLRLSETASAQGTIALVGRTLADPAADIRNARTVRMAMRGGALYDRRSFLPTQ